MFHLKSFLRKAFSAKSFKGLGEFFASLGAWGGKVEEEKPRKKKAQQQIAEPIPVEVVARLREEMLSASLAVDVIQRAKARRNRADEEALILMI